MSNKLKDNHLSVELRRTQALKLIEIWIKDENAYLSKLEENNVAKNNLR
ncbi:hypothetical protein [Filobacillus milosensis]|nr:hypothetical protein [Filobacillus milosensis]